MPAHPQRIVFRLRKVKEIQDSHRLTYGGAQFSVRRRFALWRGARFSPCGPTSDKPLDILLGKPAIPGFPIMPDLFAYTDYREFLKDYYEEQKAKDPKFSHRYFTMKVGF